MKTSNLKTWVLIIGKFLTSQGIIKFIDLITALLILRYLPVKEYALYIISSLLLTIGSTGSDLGLTQAVITLGARIQNNPTELGSLFSTARKYRRNLFSITSIIIIILTPIMLGRRFTLSDILICLLLILLSNWFEQTVSLRNSILNIHHDLKSLFQAGIITSLSRLIFTVTICKIIPIAIIAIAINLLGYIINSFILQFLGKKYLDEQEVPSIEHKQELNAFIYPLIPGVIYFIIQGQVSIFLLSLFGHTIPVAQVGALGRLGQIIGSLEMINPFFIQPYFARLEKKKKYIIKGLLIILVLLFSIIIILISSFIFPQAWLYLLGSHYNDLTHELPLALAAPLILLIGATLYRMLIAQKTTKGQSFSILISIGIQLLFIWIKGVNTASDALLMNVMLNSGYLVLQLFLMGRLLYSWK